MKSSSLWFAVLNADRIVMGVFSAGLYGVALEAAAAYRAAFPGCVVDVDAVAYRPTIGLCLPLFCS